MTDRDWGKELAKIDHHLQGMSDAELAPDRPAKTGGGAAAPPAAAGERRGVERKGTALGAFARLALSVALGVGIAFWPYEVRCGLKLGAYLAVVGVVIASGAWSAVWTWRHRTARAHVLSLLIILWGLVLGSIEILPRIGYAKGDAAHPATWACR